MATLEYNEIKPRTYVLHDGEPYEVLENQVSRTQKRKPQNQVKLRNLITGRTIPMTYHASDTAESAEISRKEVRFLYANRGEYWFSDIDNAKNRFKLDADLLGDQAKFLKDNTECQALVFGEDEDARIIGIKLPIKVTLMVKEAPPNVKGDTASGGGKMVTLETGAQITVPLFIEAGEMVVVNTDTGEYSERASNK